MKSEKNKKPARSLWFDIVMVLAITSLGGLLLALIGISSLSNVYFLAGAAFLLVSAVPIFTEFGGNARTGIRARKDGKNPLEAIRKNETSGKYNRGTRITFLFGLSGFICFGLAILTA